MKITHHGVNTLEDGEEESNLEDWIFPTVDGGLCNWEAKILCSHYFHKSVIYLSNISVGL